MLRTTVAGRHISFLSNGKFSSFSTRVRSNALSVNRKLPRSSRFSSKVQPGAKARTLKCNCIYEDEEELDLTPYLLGSQEKLEELDVSWATVDLETETDLNVLQTALRRAVEREEYNEAAALRDRISALGGGSDQLSWRDLGLPTWLSDRAERMGFLFPTSVQAQSLRALIPQITELEDILAKQEEQDWDGTVEEAAGDLESGTGRDVLIQGQTGSGKTLAFLLPCLAALSESLFQVETIRAQVGPAVLQPLALLVVPTKELGAQLAMLAWRLLGGNLSRHGPGDPANMFTYQGPKDVKVIGVLDDADVAHTRTDVEDGGLLEGCQVVVGTPRCLAQVVQAGELSPELLRFIAVDELDLCLAQDSAAVSTLLALNPDLQANPARQVALAGATLPSDVFERCVAERWIVRDPVRVGEVTSGSMEKALPTALEHRVVKTSESMKLVVLCQLLRHDVDQMKEKKKSQSTSAEADGDSNQEDKQETSKDDTPANKPRVVVFCQTEPQAIKAGERLRRAMWGVHNVVVCVTGGFEPLKALEAFRDQRASLLLATVNSARGLDLQGVTHVYSLGPPANTAEYVHRAGRSGRIGNRQAGGQVTTLVDPELGEDGQLDDIVATLRIQLDQTEAPAVPSLADLLGEELSVVDSEGDEGLSGDESGGDGAPVAEGTEDKTIANEAVINKLMDMFQLMDAQGAPLLEQQPKEPLSIAEELLERELREAQPESLPGELWERVEGSDAADSPFKANDVRKAKQCDKFIGDGCAGSYTDYYRRAVGDLGNSSSYAPQDIVYISVNGDREGRVRPVDSKGYLTGVYRDEILLAASVGTRFVTDREQDRENGYNIGELEIAAALETECGYVEVQDESGGSGMWKPKEIDI